MNGSCWQVYMILCTDGSLYTGITTDVDRRFTEHVTGKGARYFRGHTPDKVVYLESEFDRSSASRREIEIKGMRAHEKRLLIESEMNQIDSLS